MVLQSFLAVVGDGRAPRRDGNRGRGLCLHGPKSPPLGGRGRGVHDLLIRGVGALPGIPALRRVELHLENYVVRRVPPAGVDALVLGIPPAVPSDLELESLALEPAVDLQGGVGIVLSLEDVDVADTV